MSQHGWPTGADAAAWLEQHADIKLEPFQRAWLDRLYRPPLSDDVVHVITELGPTDEPGSRVQATLGPARGPFTWPVRPTDRWTMR